MNYIPLPPATIIMTFHSEGIYAHKSLLGFQRIRNYSTAKGNRLDLICILDDAESFTTKIVKDYLYQYGSSTDQVIETSWRSLSAARNTGIDNTKTEFVGFLDGDDFFSSNWVHEALKNMIFANNSILCLPEYIVNFGNHVAIQQIIPSKEIPKAQMINNHYWVSSSFSRTDNFQCIPYNENVGLKTKFAFEDWDFNLRCIAAGIEIEPVKETYLFYRRRANSMLQQHLQFNSMIPPSNFFQTLNL